MLKTTPRVFILDHSPNINTTKGQINTTGVLFNTLVFAVQNAREIQPVSFPDDSNAGDGRLEFLLVI